MFRGLTADEGSAGLNTTFGNTERGRALRQSICAKFGFASLEFQTLEGVLKAIGLPPEKLCTYCWNGKE